jgi:hypothetical protein
MPDKGPPGISLPNYDEAMQPAALTPSLPKATRRPLLAKHHALVAELVDAQVSGTCDRKVVEVRVFSWAPSFSSLESKPKGGKRIS